MIYLVKKLILPCCGFTVALEAVLFEAIFAVICSWHINQLAKYWQTNILHLYLTKAVYPDINS